MTPPTAAVSSGRVQRRGVSTRIQYVCSWGGVATVGVCFTGWLVAGVLPFPLGPADDTATVAAFYADHRAALVGGLILCTVGIALVTPLFAVIAVHMRRTEGRYPVLTVLQVLTGAATSVLLILPMLIMATTGFVPERPPEITRTLNDLAWLLFLTPIAPFILQNLAMATAILTDRRGVFPRWAGYLNLGVAFAFVPDVLAFVFRSGPFAWNSVLIFWLALTAYAVFLVAMGVAVRRPIASGASAAETLEETAART